MKKALVFGGTSDSRSLLKALESLPCTVTVCVASDYGRTLLAENSPDFTVLSGRMDAGQIEALIVNEGFFCVIDATHPYAAEVTKNIKAAAAKTGIKYFRLMREHSELDGVTVVSSAGEAAEHLKQTCGNVLLTTGSKELPAYTEIPDYDARLYPRILPCVDSVEACVKLGFQPGHIIAVQGPFSAELNIALMRQFDIKTLVTKDGGKPGGFPEKLEAAHSLGIQVIVIGRPADAGLSQPDIIFKLTKLLEAEL